MFDPYKRDASILIVDDEPNNLKVLHNLLSQNGYDVRAARDGKTALQAAEATHPDLILLDIKMPNMDGYEVCRHLKDNSELADIPVIFISALNNVTDIVKAFEVGGVDYVTKPFQFEEVLARVKNHLTIVYQQRQLTAQSEQIQGMHKRDQARFEKITEMREQFVQAATHDLKNPLAIVVGCSDLMGRMHEVRSNPNLRECVDSVQSASKEMMSLITGMLDLIKMQSTLSLNLQPADLADFVGEAVAMMRFRAQERGIDLQFNSEPESIPVRVDSQLMQRVVDNLLSNAIKYSPDETTVKVNLSIKENKAILHIIDEGYGIAEDQISYLFEPFYRGMKRDGDREIEGTGLGLSIVKELVEQHGGHIYVESQIGKGSTFMLALRLDE